MAVAPGDWLYADRTPTDVFELLGRKRLDPDTAALLADARAAYRALLAYQNHSDRGVSRRAMQLLTELGRIADIHTNPRQLDRYLEQVIERLRREYLTAVGGPAGLTDFARLRTWLAENADVHPDSIEAAMLAILEPSDLQATLETAELPPPDPVAATESAAELPSADAGGIEPAATERSVPRRPVPKGLLLLLLLVPLAVSAAAFSWGRSRPTAEQAQWTEPAEAKRAPEPAPVAAAAAPKAEVPLPPLQTTAPADFLPARRAYLVVLRPRALCSSPIWDDLCEVLFAPVAAFQESFYRRRGIGFEQLTEIGVAGDGDRSILTLRFVDGASRAIWLKQHRFASIGRRREVEVQQAPDRACAALVGATVLVLGPGRAAIEESIDRAAVGAGAPFPDSSLVHLEIDDWLQFARLLDRFANLRAQFVPLSEQALEWARSVEKLSVSLATDGSVRLQAFVPHRQGADRLAGALESWRLAVQQALVGNLRSHGLLQSTPAAERLLALTTGRVQVFERRVEYTAQRLVVRPPSKAPAAPRPRPAASSPPAPSRAEEEAVLTQFRGAVQVIFAEGASLPTRPALDGLKARIEEEGLAAAAHDSSALRYRGSAITIVMESPPTAADVVGRLGNPSQTQQGILRHDASGRPASVTWHCYGRLDFAVAGGRVLAVRIHTSR